MQTMIDIFTTSLRYKQFDFLSHGHVFYVCVNGNWPKKIDLSKVDEKRLIGKMIDFFA